jgi:general secretion pathway protein I
MRGNRNRGFTLIEMVIAFAILGISLTALFGVFETSLARTRHDARLSEATLLAESLLARAGTEIPLDGAKHTGAWQEFDYELTGEPVNAARGQTEYTVPTTTVIASVTWHESAASRTITLSSLKFLPRAIP